MGKGKSYTERKEAWAAKMLAKGAEFVSFTSYDGYTTNVRIEDLLDGDALLADQCGYS